ncbi:EthD family reductase [Paenibacillus hamazuiensis]|uniref:EthD family reductase n=1 Tax=Paenibacillus hamazuiensis TaxID=2936508 RepID=UPI00200EF070|nr:EthD family reductase [Paenibacillus hamazuiensis]
MVRFLVLYTEPNDIEAFENHYREVHIPLAKKLPGLRHYSLSHNTVPIRGGDPYYLVAELDWDSMEEINNAFRSPEERATGEDAGNLERLSPGVHCMIYELEEIL